MEELLSQISTHCLHNLGFIQRNEEEKSGAKSLKKGKEPELQGTRPFLNDLVAALGILHAARPFCIPFVSLPLSVF